MNDVTAPTDTQTANAPGRASGSSFYTAMRILPRAQREARFEIYSYCRLVDDVADSDAPRAERLHDLSVWRDRIAAIYAGNPPAELAALAGTVRDFGLRKEDFLAVIDGMEMDAAQDIRAPDWTTLDLYCDRVASAVGRLSVRIFGMDEAEGIALAHHLGRALQLTNILRDVDEDAGLGRLYLPAEALRSAGVEGEVRLQFVVDTTGRVESGSVKVARATNDLFASAARASVPRMRFYPAEIGSRKVRQLVELPITFQITR